MTAGQYVQLLGAMVHDATLEHTVKGGRTAPVVIEREITDRELFVDAMRSSRDLVDWVGPCLTELMFLALRQEEAQ